MKFKWFLPKKKLPSSKLPAVITPTTRKLMKCFNFSFELNKFYKNQQIRKQTHVSKVQFIGASVKQQQRDAKRP